MNTIHNSAPFKVVVSEVLDQIGEAEVSQTITQVLEKHLPSNLCLASNLKTQWLDEVTSEVCGFGPIKILVEDPAVTEICINGFDEVFFEKAGLLQIHNRAFCSPLTYLRFVKNLLKWIDKTGDIRHPLVDGVLKSDSLHGDMRIHICLPPVCPSPTVTIRKHSQKNWKLDDLMLQKMFPEGFLDKLKKWIYEKKNILVCGPTGAGKTTFMRAVLLECSKDERIVSLEDTPELGVIGSHHVCLFTRQDAEGLVPAIDLSTLLRNSLRMRPDRIVVGEVRGAEALTLLDALSTGHRGAICTLHAHSPQHALKRLESLILRASSQWSMQAVRQIILDSIDVVIICSKKNGLRYISQTALLRGAEDFGYLLEPIEVSDS